MEGPLHTIFAVIAEGAFDESTRDLPPPFPCAATDAPLHTKLIAGTSLSVWLAAWGCLFALFRPPFFHS
jgi:hypothetical protein